MRISFLIPRLRYSGAPKILAWVANQMHKQGHVVEIVAFFTDEKEQELLLGVKFHYLGIKQSRNRIVRDSFGMAATLSKLHKHLKETKPDVVVSFLDSVGYMFLLTNKLTSRYKVVVSERIDPYQKKGIMHKIRFKMMELADGYVFQTQGARNFFCEKIKNKGSVIPNPAVIKVNETIANCTYAERDYRIVTVGRLNMTQKRQDVLLKAFAIVKESHPDFMLYIYGDGEDREAIEKIRDELNLENSVFLPGSISNVEEEIYNARVFVMTSDFEGIPNALIEAMAIGVPSVSTNCSPGGASMLIKNGENGFIVNCGDIEDVAEKISILIEDERISNQFSIESRYVKELLSEERIAEMWNDYFNKIKGE